MNIKNYITFINESSNKQNIITNILLRLQPIYMKEFDRDLIGLNSGACEDIAYECKQKLNDINFFDVDILDDGFFWSIDDISNYKTLGGDSWNIEAFIKYGIPPFKYEKLSEIDLVGHVWIYSNGKHYDIEEVNGVDNFWNLPIYQRQIKKELLK